MSKPEKKKKKSQRASSGYIYHVCMLQGSRCHPNKKTFLYIFHRTSTLSVSFGDMHNA